MLELLIQPRFLYDCNNSVLKIGNIYFIKYIKYLHGIKWIAS